MLKHLSEPCQITDEVWAALGEYVFAAGRNWRSILSLAWERNEQLGQELQLVRNVVGPSGLKKIATSHVLGDRYRRANVK